MFLRITIILLVGLISAFQVYAYGDDAASFGYVAGNIYGTTSIVARLMWAACVISGIALLITAFTQIQTHRNNPKLMPLTTPITYILLGLVALAIPFAERILGFEDGDVDSSQSRLESSELGSSVPRKKPKPKYTSTPNVNAPNTNQPTTQNFTPPKQK